MTRTLRPLALVGAGLLCAALLASQSPVSVRSAPVRGFEAKLAEALSAGELDEAHADLYRLWAVVAAERLPPRFRADFAEPAPLLRAGAGESAAGALHKCGTSVLRAVRGRLREMPPDVRSEAEALLEPPKPSLDRAARAAGKTVSHVLPNWIETANFSIEWGSALTNEDGSLPLRDEDGDGLPDVAELWASYFEATYQEEVVRRGFSRGALGGNLIPVYLGNSDASRSVDNISSTFYAFTQETAPTPYIVVNNDLRFVPPNGEGTSGLPKIRGAMKVTAAHEFFHVLQFLTPLPSAWIDNADNWWLETSATWMEDEVFDEVNDYYQYFAQLPGESGWTDFVEQGLPVSFDDPHYTLRAYGGAIFGKYLAEHTGGAAAMGQVWGRIAAGGRPLPALEGYAVAKGFSGLGQLFPGFAAANATMDYREGGQFGAVPVRQESLAGTSPPLPAVSYLGSTSLRDTAGGGPATVTLTGANTVWGVALSLSRGTQYALALASSQPGNGVSAGVSRFAPGDTLYAIPCNLQAGSAQGSYTTSVTPAGPSQTQPAVTLAGVGAEPGGFDLSWALDLGAAGTVVRWKPDGAATFAARTVAAPITSAEIRGLAAGSYEIEVFAYDHGGNEGAAATRRIQVQDPPPVTPTPPVAIVASHLAPASSGGGGGGGGGGCFLTALGL